jgi:hypothetical protein
VKALAPSLTRSLCLHDAAICHSSRSMGTIDRRLLGANNRLSLWAREKRLTFSPDKIKCLPFTRLRGSATRASHTHTVVFRPSFLYRDDFLTSAPRPVSVRVQNLLQRLGIQLPPLYPPQTPICSTLGYPVPYLRSASY